MKKKAPETQPVLLSSAHDSHRALSQELGTFVAASSATVPQPRAVRCWSRARRLVPRGSEVPAPMLELGHLLLAPSPTPRTPGRPSWVGPRLFLQQRLTAVVYGRMRLASHLASPHPSRGTLSPFSQFATGGHRAFCSGGRRVPHSLCLVVAGPGHPAGTVPSAWTGQTGISLGAKQIRTKLGQAVESEIGRGEHDSGCVTPGQRCTGRRKSLLIHGLASSVAYWDRDDPAMAPHSGEGSQ